MRPSIRIGILGTLMYLRRKPPFDNRLVFPALVMASIVLLLAGVVAIAV